MAKEIMATDPILNVQSIVAELQAKGSIEVQREVLSSRGFSPMCPKLHKNGDECIIMHFGTGGTNRGYPVITSDTSTVKHYYDSNDTRNSEFYKRTSIPEIVYSGTGF